MIDPGENTSGPPRKPFYEEPKARRPRPSYSPRTQAWLEKKRAAYEAELAKPVAERPGRLKTRRDYTDEEWAELQRLYGGKK